jgi:hypothetical protein
VFKLNKKFTIEIYLNCNHGFPFLKMDVSHEITSLCVLCLSFILRVSSPKCNAITWYKTSLCVFPKVGKTKIRTKEPERWAEGQLSYTGWVLKQCIIKVFQKYISINLWIRVRFPMRKMGFVIAVYRWHCDPLVDTASNINEYQEYFLGGKRRLVSKTDKITTFTWRPSRNSGNLNFLCP